jgi:hypothetical protein
MAELVYSSASEAAAKRALDRQLLAENTPSYIRMDSESYLRDLIRYGSKGRIEVRDKARGLQFFIVRGGAEGFLWSDLAGIDASRYRVGSTTTSGASGNVTVFDLNDLLAVFDAKGTLINSCILARPISISTAKDPLFWTERTAEKVYAAWDNSPVSIYRNTYFDIKYYGLWVNDSAGYYANGWVRIDIHKKEATNGCIFIMDPNTPDYSAATKSILSAWEPQLIKDIQAAVGAAVKWGIGTMRMVEIQ